MKKQNWNHIIFQKSTHTSVKTILVMQFAPKLICKKTEQRSKNYLVKNLRSEKK